jgi:hypothetical protein
MIQKKYHLEWFDCLIIQELNARSGVLQSITIAESK